MAIRGEGDAVMEKSTGAVPGKATYVPVNPSDPDAPLVLSYLGLRKAVGIIGLTLPFVLAFGRILLQGFGLEGSISCYYYTDMGNVFVGSLCAIGVFLLSCRGYDQKDAIAGRLACLFAVGGHLQSSLVLRGIAFSHSCLFLPGAVYPNCRRPHAPEAAKKHCLSHLRVCDPRLYPLDRGRQSSAEGRHS